MTKEATLVERLRHGVPLVPHFNGGEVADTDAADATMEEAATSLASKDATIERLTSERDEAVDDAKFAERIAAKREVDANARAEAAERALDDAVKALERAETAARHIMPYLDWTIGPESLTHHPTMPSAVAAFHEAFPARSRTGGANG